jgi:hypothetical protein
MADPDVRQGPPWNWSELEEEQRHIELRDLAAWVADLQRVHGRWVRLPPCWPCHRGLRDELAAFWYWRQRLDRPPVVGFEENVRWYQFMRAAAQAWAEAYGGCRHESSGEVDEGRVDLQAEQEATRGYLERAMNPKPSESVGRGTWSPGP